MFIIFLIAISFSSIPNSMAFIDYEQEYQKSVEAREALKRSIHNKMLAKKDYEAIKSSYLYFASNPSLMSKLKPKVAAEFAHFTTLNENEREEYLRKALTNRGAALAVAGGAAAAALIAREISPSVREIVVGERGNLINISTPINLTCPDEYFDPMTDDEN